MIETFQEMIGIIVIICKCCNGFVCGNVCVAFIILDIILNLVNAVETIENA